MRWIVPLLVLSLAGCNRSRDESADHSGHGPAYQVGRAAREVARGTAKVAKAAGKEIKHGAHEAHEGWKDQSRADRAKGKP